MVSVCKARAFANVALVKYFGKRNSVLNLPAASSLSLTLSPLETTTSVDCSETLDEDVVMLNGERASEQFCSRVKKFLKIVRNQSDDKRFARVNTLNSFPTGAGLASSASGFAALALAASEVFSLNCTESELSALARRGSGSASRSIPGGTVLWHRGDKKDGSDSFAETIEGPNYWDLRIVAGITDYTEKEVGSTRAMEHTRQTSPYYEKWIDSVTSAVEEALQAVQKRDITRLGEISEHSALAMHAASIASRPGILFFNGTTVEAFHLARRMRADGIAAYFTCDAGPQPKILCESRDAKIVEKRLLSLRGVREVIHCVPAGGARIDSTDQ